MTPDASDHRRHAVTRVVSALMDNKGGPDDEQYAYLDPKLASGADGAGSATARSRNAFSQALVFVNPQAAGPAPCVLRLSSAWTYRRLDGTPFAAGQDGAVPLAAPSALVVSRSPARARRSGGPGGLPDP